MLYRRNGCNCWLNLTWSVGVMNLDNKVETQKTIDYLRDLADKLENNQIHLNEIVIESRNVCWNVEEETLTMQVLKAVDNG
ncbi:hypothetical protein PUNNY_78 [Escherichia phage_vB_EcoD_Punny]|nr:hypothetical protein PUNNY_78 [Escherichia phage_vB_EcoD_Punny]UGO53588.1 hypothetical protein DEVORATOR_72 [Citrobacter phage_vB_CfrD_Devorator]UGO53881.1 hypothetical protein REINASAURUS_69 [Citrobacter phage vB_CfrD_Reinasaurus]